MTPADYFRQQQEQADQAVKHAALLASQPLPKTPDEYAQSARLAKSMALPTAVIDPQYKTFAQKMTEKRNEMILSTAPVLTGWVATGDNYRVAADDLEGLSWFEGFGQGLWNTARRAGERAGLMYEQGMLEHTAGRARDRTMTFGQIIDDEREVIKGASGREVKAWARPGDLLSAFARWADARYADLGGIDDAGNARDYAAQVAESRKAIAAIPKSQIATTFEKQAMVEGSSLGETLANFGKAIAGNPIGALSWALETAGESAPTLAAAAGVTAVTRNPVAGVAAMGAGSYATERFTSPSEFFTEKGLDLSKAEDVTRLLADPKLMKEAQDRGVIRGAVIGAFDAISGGVAGKALAGNPLVEGLAQGVAQAVMGSSGEYAARLAAGQEIDWNEIVAEGVAEMATAPIDMGTAGRSFVRDRRAAAHAEERVAQVEELSGAAQASALRNRLPDGFRDYLDQALADGPVENVFVPAQDFVEYFQSQGIDPWELTNDLDGVTRDDLDAALAGGGDLQIPTATYAAKIAGSEADPFFMENMRFSPNEMTAREAAEFNDRAQDVMAEAWNEAERIRVEDEALRGVEERIFVDMQSRLRQAGRATDVANAEATLYPAFYRVMAERSGLTTEEFLARYPLPQVEGARPEGMQTKDVTAFNRTLAEARTRKAPAKDKRKSLLEFISERGGINDPGGELRARDAQVVKRGKGKKTLRLARDTSGDSQGALLPGGSAGISYSVDDVAVAAIEAGFMADNPDVMAYRHAMEQGGEVPDLTRALWDAIDAELRGDRQVSADEAAPNTDADAALDDLEEYLNSLSVSLDDSDADILAAVRQDEDARRYAQDGAEAHPLYVVHNLSEDKLRHAVDLGGLAAPSLAVARGDIGFDGFGEISLIGDPSLANPKAKGVRLFNADVYSPRQPRARFKVNAKARRAMKEFLAPAAEKLGLDIDRQRIGEDDIERGGLSEVEMTDAAKAAWLESKGEALPLVYREVKAPEAYAGMEAFKAVDAFELVDDPAFIAVMRQKYESLRERQKTEEGIARVDSHWLDRNGEVSGRSEPTQNWAGRVARFNKEMAEFTPGVTEEVDTYRTSQAMTDAIGERMPEYRDWVRAQFGDVVGPAFFENASGRKRDYTLSNVVREMTRELRNGENWNYGVGNVRAAVAPEFKSMSEVKAARDQITSSAAMEALKDETNNELFALAGKFAPYHSSGEDFGWGDIFSDFLKDVAKGPRALNEWQTQWFNEPAPDALIDEARAFLDKLKALPTEYFEIKMQRAMDLSEFAAAIVPSDLSADAREVLTSAGLELVEYDKGKESARRDAIQGIGDRVFFQDGSNAPRGSIQFSAAGVGNGDTIIRLSERADLSTFLHESGHYFLTIMQDMAGQDVAIGEEFSSVKGWWRENAGAVASDARKAFPELEITPAHVEAAIDTGTSGDAAIDRAIDVGMQEQWARGFEQYVMEGKAPSAELRSAFERFRAWLLSIYRKLSGLNVNVSDDLRRVFDRMIATDEEIAQATADAGGSSALFATAEEMGLTPEEFDRFTKLRTQAEEEAKARLLAETMAPIRREREKWFKEERANVRETVEREVNAYRQYRAIEWMGNRRWIGEGQPEAMPDMRLSKDALVNRYGEGVLRTLPRGKQTVYAVEGGFDPDEAAGWFGFGSGDEMLQAMEQATPRKEAIEAETDKRMRETHGDVLRDGSIEEQALDAVHNDKRGQWLAAELKAVTEVAGTDNAMTVKQAREVARQTINRMRVRDAMAANRFLAAERKAGAEAAKLGAILAREGVWMGNARRRIATKARAALREAGTVDAVAGQVEQANASTENYNETVGKLIEAKRRQLLNHALYSEARKVAEEVGKAERFVSTLNKASKREKIAGAGRREDAQIDYLGAIDEILDRYDFRRISGKAEDRRGSLNAYVDAMRAAGRENEIAIPAAVLDGAARVPYKTLPVEELRGVVDSLKNLEHVALRWNKLIDAQKERDFDAAVGDVVGEFEANIERRPPGRVGSRAERLRNGMRQFIDLVLNATTVLREIDGFKDQGGSYQNIKAPIDAAMNRLTLRKRKAATDLEALYDVYSKDERRKMSDRVHLPELGYALSKWEMIAVALNTGNEGNYQRLTDPRVNGSLTDDQVQAVLGKLDARDAKFVQSVWDYLETFRPDIAARERRATGVEPGWVEGQPVTIAGLELKGGYYPLRYDARLSALARDDAANDIAAAMQAGRFGKAQTKNGHLEARAQSSGRAVELDMAVMHRHVNQVIYDLELSEPVSNSWRILQAAPVRDQFIQTGKQADFEALETWLKDTAEGQVGAGDWMNSMARTVKSNFTAAKLAFNLSTVAMQLTGVAQTMVVVGKRDFVRGLQASFRAGIGDEIAAKSAFMSERQTTFNKDINDFYDDPKLGPAASRWGDFKREIMGPASFWLMTKVQWYTVDVPTWLAGYQQGLRKFGNNEERAVAHADGIVKRAQASGLFSDRSAIERGSLSGKHRQNDVIRLFTTLGSYMFAKFNVAYERTAVASQTMSREGISARSAQEAVSWTIDMAFLFTLEAVLMAAVKGGLPQDDDEEDKPGWAEFLAKQTALSVMGTVPFIRDGASALQGFDGGGAYGSAISTIGKAGQGAWNVLTAPFTEDGEVKRTDIKNIINGTGLATGLPATQVNRVVDAAWRQSEGEEVSPAEYLIGKQPKK